MKHRIISVSGGKDSMATVLDGIEKGLPSRYVFADTGNEHELVYEYLDYMEDRLGITIERVKADFSKQMATRRRNLADPETKVHKSWLETGWSEEDIAQVIELLVPTGIPFLDLAMLKGRFTSTTRPWCSVELKQIPMRRQIVDPILDEHKRNIVISVQGVRADESLKRANRSPCERMDDGLYYQYPIFQWTAEDVFKMHRRHNVEANKLYSMGCGRVGCMPCINVRKDELMNIAHRFPEHIDRVSRWENIVSKVAKRRASTFLPAANLGVKDNDKCMAEGNIYKHVEWSKTSRGGAAIRLPESRSAPSLRQHLWIM